MVTTLLGVLMLALGSAAMPSFGLARQKLVVAALLSVPGDVLQTLGEMSWDTLLLLVGLGFVAVAILGDISGKISPGKVGRIAAAVVGVGLIASGLWYHSVLHGFKVTALDVAPIPSQSGSCPLPVSLQGIVDATGSGNVIYYFEFSNGNATASATTKFEQTDSQIVPGVWEVQEPLKDAWVRLHVIAPADRASRQSKAFSVACEAARTAPSPVREAPAPAGAAPSTTRVAPGAIRAARPPVAAPEPPPPAVATPAAPPEHTVDNSTNSIELDSVEPKPGTFLKRGQPVPFDVNISYNLISADSAILSLSTVQLRTSGARCSGASGELVDAVEVPVVRGRHQVRTRLTWSGDTGSATKGRIYGNGFLSFSPMFWASNNGARGARLNFFGTYGQYCYPFGP